MTRRTTSGAPAPERRFGGRSRRALAGLTAATLFATTASVLTAGTASAAVPTAPDNLLVFPNRDFITIEGYQSHAGEVATIELTRAGKVIGSARGTVSGGDVAFEVNHPGGVCWGAGTGVNVTPDVQPGDTATIKFGGTAFGDTTVQSAGWANDPAGVPTPSMSLATTNVKDDTLVVKGAIGATDVPLAANMEQRIVNADGFRTNLGKRDIRAVPGPLTPAPKTGTSSYSSSLVSDATSFTATYVFSDPAVATIAKDGGGQRLLQWQQVDAAANRQGVTIAEAGELGGPGFGGCPNGPGNVASPAGSATVVRSADKASAKVNWTAATAAPGATPVSGYSIEAIATTANAAGEKPGVLIRTGAAATSTTLALDPAATYDIEVRSIAGTGLSAPFGGTAATPTTPKDTVIPTLTVTPAGGTEAAPTAATSVTAISDNGQIFYTDDGTLATFGDGPSATAKIYTGPVAITKATNLSFAAFDTAGNGAKPAQDGWYAPDASPAGVLAAPTGLKATNGQSQVTLAWDAVPTATGYQVSVYDSTGATKLTAQPPANTGTSQIVTLPAGSYQFTVATKNTAGNLGAESAAKVTGSSTAATDTLTITRPVFKTNDFRVVGSSSAPSGTVSVYTVDPVANPTARPIAGMTDQPLTAAAAPATGSTFDIRLRNTTGLARPATIWVKSSNGGVKSSPVG